jgi:hypothetical protein
MRKRVRLAYRNREAVMNGLQNRTKAIAVALMVSSAVCVATPGFAVPRYDGLWSVSIVTTKGDCVASYRYPMLIANGVLANGGLLPITVSGKVAASGAIKAKLTHGDTRAAAVGRLSGSAGAGSWSGASCSGSWTAERRSS